MKNDLYPYFYSKYKSTTMTKRLLSLAMLCLPVLAFGQVTLDETKTPPLNSMMTYYDANVPSPIFMFNTSGTSNTWDFSSMFASSIDEDTLFIADPASIPYSNLFPSATHATYEGGGDSYSMIRIDATGITYLGSVSDLNDNGVFRPLIINPELLAMPFQYAYGSTASGTGYFELFETGAFIDEPTIDSIHFKSSITGQRDVVASGDMIIPSGTFPAILERRIDTKMDTLWIKGAATGNIWMVSPGFPESYLDSSFYWYTNYSNQPYAHALFDDLGLHDVNYFKDMITGISEVNNTFNTVVYPNPSNGILNLILPPTTQKCSFTIFNTNGQIVAKGSNTLNQLNLSNLPAGMYSLQLTTADSKASTTKFVRQ